MAFFKIKDPNYNAEQIEAQIVKSLKNRDIPYEQVRKMVEKYNLETIRKDPLLRLKIFLNHMPRWILRIAKVLPFYGSIRNFLKINETLKVTNPELGKSISRRHQ